jgi:hypothetical protein
MTKNGKMTHLSPWAFRVNDLNFEPRVHMVVLHLLLKNQNFNFRHIWNLEGDLKYSTTKMLLFGLSELNPRWK